MAKYRAQEDQLGFNSDSTGSRPNVTLTIKLRDADHTNHSGIE